MTALFLTAFVLAQAPTDAERALGAFCRDVELAGKVTLEGPLRDELLEDCLLAPGKPVLYCAKVLGLKPGTVQAIRARHGYFAVQGLCSMGCGIGLSQKHSKVLARFQGSMCWATEIVSACQDRLGAEEGLRWNLALEKSRRLVAAGQAPLAFGGTPSKVTPAMVDSAHVRYALLLGNGIARTQRNDVRRCLERQRQGVLEQVQALPAWQAAMRLQAKGRALAERAREHPRIGPDWNVIVLHADPEAASPFPVQVIIENRRHSKATNWMDTRVRIFPWIKLALRSEQDGEARRAGIAQPALSPEPEADREEYNLLASAQDLLLYWQPSRLREFGWTAADLAKLQDLLVEALGQK
ncbi:MAG TPA: hypothetical protein VJ801_11600 [Polyangia bacterium]|jgi:hypothetical protein|nr:hypothetical protein [Polyangia bacterium]